MDHKKSSTMVRNTIKDTGYDNLKPGMTATMKLRSPDSPGSFSKSRSKSPGVGRISNRKWSPGQATLIRRKKIEGETSVDDSLEDLALNDILNDTDDGEEDYLTLALASTSDKGRTKRSGRRPISSKSIDRSDPDSNPRVRRPPRKSYSTGNTRLNVERLSRQNKSTSNSPSRRRSTRKTKSKSMEKTKRRTLQKDLPLDIQKRLYRVTDPDLSIKEKVELELEFMKGTSEEKRIYLAYRHHFDRQEFFGAREFTEQEQQEKIEANAREEKKKEAEFLMEVERKRQKERQKEEEAKERERQAKEAAKLHAIGTIADTMSEIKNAALQAATVSVARNQYEKKTYEDERKKLVEDFRKKEGKDMTDVQRALKEAVIEQEDPEEKRLRLRGNRPYRHRSSS
mmetsp:Transcript_6499/g.13449  ORF Transcript_6499/g.13449 Transcript_6499/m.13449 type:complete len:398 (-) Transcript_6499:251-1444(-)